MGVMDKVLAAAAAKDVEAAARDILSKVNALGLSDEQKFGAALLARQVVAVGREKRIIGEKTQEAIEGYIRAFLPAGDGKG
jgi:hypothetical protein